MKIHKNDTAVVVIDPQNVVLSEKGVLWRLVGDSVKENNTVRTSRTTSEPRRNRVSGSSSLLSYLYPTDQAWQFGGAVEKMMLEGKEFWRPGPLDLDGFSGSGADWLECYKTFIEDGKTVVVSPTRCGARKPTTSTSSIAVTTCRRLSKRFVTVYLCRPCNRPPPRSSPAGRACGSPPWGKGTGPGPTWAWKLLKYQSWTSARGVAGSRRRIVSPA